MGEQANIAVDLAKLCERLSVKTSETGENYLATRFHVAPSSPQFYEIIAVIIGMTHTIESALDASTLHPLAVENGRSHLDAIRAGFAVNKLSGNWHPYGVEQLGAAHRDPVLMLSGSLPSLNYEKPSNEDVQAILADAQDLLGWLEEHEIDESDFIRLCIIDGLKRFIFRVEAIGWVGWPYAVEGLREVVGAYLALERGHDPELHPKATALMQKVTSKLTRAFSFVGKGRDASENIDFLLSVYRGAIQPGAAFIAGYLSSGGS